jgi:hypothetical protein
MQGDGRQGASAMQGVSEVYYSDKTFVQTCHRATVGLKLLCMTRPLLNLRYRPTEVSLTQVSSGPTQDKMGLDSQA